MSTDTTTIPQEVIYIPSSSGRRLLAYFIDAFSVAVVAIGMATAIGKMDYSTEFFYGMFFVYCVALDRKGSLGKRALGIRIADNNGLAIDEGKHFTRTLLKVGNMLLMNVASFEYTRKTEEPSNIFPLISLVVFALNLFFALKGTGQLAHDKITHTHVLRTTQRKS